MSASKLDHARKLVAEFKNQYANLDHATCSSDLIEQIYQHDKIFKDSFHTIGRK